MICLKYQNGRISGKCLSILMFQNKPKRFFFHKIQRLTHPPVLFNNIPVKRCSIQKHLVINLDEKLSFNYHVKEKITKGNKGIGVIKKLSNTLSRDALFTIEKSFLRLHLDYGDIIYD